EAGVRHFDVARSYGRGEAERLLGEFLRDRRDEATITTKFGITPPRTSPWRSAAKAIARPIARRAPGVKRLLAAAADAGVAHGSFDAASVRASLETSFCELGVDRVDVLLMHEAGAADARSPEVRKHLRELQAAGAVGLIGVGSHEDATRDMLAEGLGGDPDLAVFQFANDLVGQQLEAFRSRIDGAVVTHSAVARPLPLAERFFADAPERLTVWSARLGADLADRRVLADILLGYAVRDNERGPVLFSSLSPENIRRNVNAAEAAVGWSASMLSSVRELGDEIGTAVQPRAPGAS
ncbi:MAG: aldo/keto reductase, partial [Caulobacterales bacterium]|nr:aldo/keto reductase [Caulobacterales bacterium]